jgi:adenylylsulfate kinase
MSWAVWVTGLPASGKSSLARATAARLRAAGETVIVLELDEIRRIITPSPTYTDTERDVVYRALVYMASALITSGSAVIIDATAHRRAWRDLARQLIPRFAEVQLVCPLDVCRERERQRARGDAPSAIYARAGGPGAMVPGVDVPYEPARRPELTIDTRLENADVSVIRLVALTKALGTTLGRRGDAPAAWVIWITGRPGSGKTTLAWTAAESLAARSMAVRVLEFAESRRMLLDGGPESETARDIIHRTLAYTAKLLAEIGVPVIVDATAPRRAWRQLARALIAHFAEVQLVCPFEICGERERATRWRLGPQPWPRRDAGSPAIVDVVLDYEEALHPELTLHTDTQDVARSLDELLQLAQRLQRAATIEGSTPPRLAIDR